MVLTEAVRMAEGNTSPINNMVVNNSVATATGIAPPENTNNKVSSPTRLAEPTLPDRPPPGSFDGTPSMSAARNKAPIYTRDKRTKFTQRENKKWVRLATVLGYLVAVCIPAIALSIYYIGFWDPHYTEQYAKEANKNKDQKPHVEQCCKVCNCQAADAATVKPMLQFTTVEPPTSSKLPLAADREVRHLSRPVDAANDATSAPGIAYESLSEKAAENAYYRNVVVGKNYVIYGAVPDDSSLETPKDTSSPSGDPVLSVTESFDRATTIPTAPSFTSSSQPHEKQVHSGGV